MPNNLIKGLKDVVSHRLIDSPSPSPSPESAAIVYIIKGHIVHIVHIVHIALFQHYYCNLSLSFFGFNCTIKGFFFQTRYIFWSNQFSFSSQSL